MDSGLCERTNMVLGLNARSCPGQTEPLQTQAGAAGPGRGGAYLEGLARLRQEQPRWLVLLHVQQHFCFEGPQLGKGRAGQASPSLFVYLQNL